jgi:DNA repair protein RecO (recombination protein O)
MILTVKAMVIREYVVGESDKFVTLFTKELGKIQASASQAKKYTKGLTTGTQLFVYGIFTLTSYRNTYKIIQIEVLKTFHHLREDLTRLSYATYLSEFLLHVTYEEVEAEELLYLSLLAIKRLEKQTKHYKLTRSIFEIRAMALLGYMPQLKACTLCGKEIKEHPDREYTFSIENGGIICQECLGNHKGLLLSFSTYYTLQYIVWAPLKTLFQFETNDKILIQLDKIAESYVSYYIEKSFKTLSFIKSIESMN